MLEDLKRKTIIFNIAILLLFISIATNMDSEELYIHIPLLIGVIALSLVLITLSNKSESR